KTHKCASACGASMRKIRRKGFWARLSAVSRSAPTTKCEGPLPAQSLPALDWRYRSSRGRRVSFLQLCSSMIHDNEYRLGRRAYHHDHEDNPAPILVIAVLVLL